MPTCQRPSIQYIAGFFDGEGGIGISAQHFVRQSNYIGRRVDIIKWRCQAYICNSERDVLKAIQKKIGGNVSKGTQQNPNSKPAYRLNFTGGATTKRVLLLLLPYLIVKRQRANLAIKFIGTYRGRARGGGYWRLPRAVHEYRFKLYKKMAALNGRGVNWTPRARFVLPAPKTPRYVPCRFCYTPIQNRQKRDRAMPPSRCCRKCFLAKLAGRPMTKREKRIRADNAVRYGRR